MAAATSLVFICRSWARPRLAKRKTEGASFRTAKVAASAGRSSMGRRLPNPNAMPSFSAAEARIRLIRRAFLGAAGHARDHERGGQPPAEQGGGKIDLVEGQLGQRRVHELHTFQQIRARKATRARGCDMQVVGFSLRDVSRSGAGHGSRLFDHSRRESHRE